mmetsp:Transcript_101967/g.255539  ORF Transcript_101967/g.255539 Transcript_101967/m.255539 type:complete len:237 (+) Transcript_101967:1963-2673(+)
MCTSFCSSFASFMPFSHGDSFPNTFFPPDITLVPLMRCLARLSGAKNSYAMRFDTSSLLRLRFLPYFCLTLNSMTPISAGVFCGCTTSPAGGFAVPGSLPVSARKARTTRTQKKRKVTTPSTVSTTSGLTSMRMTNSQTYAKTEKKAVMPKTPRSLILRYSPAGIETTHTAVMQRRLKAALPTMVEGPSSLDWKVGKMPMTFSKISGALEPSAMSVRLATVGFQTLLVRCFCSALS